MWKLRLLGGLAVLAGSMAPAQADLRACNVTGTPVAVAIAYFEDGWWYSEGWWNVAPFDCAEIITGPLPHDVYYWHATNRFGTYTAQEYAFCVETVAFVARGDVLCEERGFRTAFFTEIPPGPEDLTLTLTTAMAPLGTPGAVLDE